MHCPGLIPINQNYLLDESQVVKFDIFACLEVNKRPHPVLIASRGTPIPTIKAILANRRKQFGRLYIRQEANRAYQAFLEDSICHLLADPSLSFEEKSKIIYNCAANVLKDLFEDPRSGKNIARTRQITDNIVSYILANDNSILSLLQLGSHDYYTFTHSVNVAVFAVGLWQMIGKGSESELLEFALGCIMHDVGKAEIADAILKKPGKLNVEEFEVIKCHPRNGYELMESELAPLSLDIILHHHERFCGTGYPDGLKGEQISDNAKICTIADVYDALTTNRPYADARDPFNAVLLMKEEMVGHFEQEKFLKFISFLGGRNR